MKKYLFLTMALATTISLVACSTTSNSDESNATDEEEIVISESESDGWNLQDNPIIKSDITIF